ncbi:ser thr protein phosphatase superfamily [Colletotrichum incanum]|uniref:Ser thr protein phosphatase superfamily n=1 Tax=Colletotrichum incanum TaxID=1573173 RepID=A0A166VRH8_COLIC|nr:ser thr protein phosphatase superfamily [Colletotrichum incanum]
MASIQIVSDLHLSHRHYDNYHIAPKAPYPALLGDIGCVKDAGFISFLDRQLSEFRAVFHVLGNHEPYGSSWDDIRERLHTFQETNQQRRREDASAALGEYVLMVKTITEDPRRKIVILTHHSPTEDSRAVKQLHANSNLRSGFSTDLRGQLCWDSPQVRLWAFGHTHYNCDFVDEGTGKRVYTNQKGYSTGRSAGFREGHVVQIS